jgi:dTMP kinase
LAKHRGLLVTLEGPDGAGKSTQALLLASALKRRGIRVVLTREPGGSPLAAKIRELVLDPRMRGLHPSAELLLFAADRRQHVADTIAPALERGDLVLCDRFADSTTAYQGAGRELAAADVAWINRFAAQGLVPDLTLFFDVPVAEGLKRAGRRKASPDRMEASSLAYFGRVRRAFLRLAREEPGRVKRIKVRGRGRDEICAEALGLLEGVLRKAGR